MTSRLKTGPTSKMETSVAANESRFLETEVRVEPSMLTINRLPIRVERDLPGQAKLRDH